MKKYYVSANTANGFINHLSSNLQNIENIIVLKHPSNTLKTAVFKNVIDHYQSKYDLELLLSSLQSEFLEGIIVREKALAIIDNRIATTNLNNTIEIDLQSFLGHKPVLDKSIEEKINDLMEDAYTNFKKGLKIHDNLEAIYIKEMDFKKADALADKFIKELLKDHKKKNRKSTIYRRLFGTNTADGVVNEVPHILDQVKHVYHVKGRAGTGKSTFMRRVVSACEKYGFDLEIYHCSFDPKSLDMLLVRELDFCIFDSTDPHEFFPQRDGEYIIDLYEEAVNPDTDEKYKEQINRVNAHYKSFMKKGVAALKKAGEYRAEYEKQFNFATKEIEHITNFLLNQDNI